MSEKIVTYGTGVYFKAEGLSGSQVTIPKAEYEEMRRELQWLRALETAGVHEWDGYERAERICEEWMSK